MPAIKPVTAFSYKAANISLASTILFLLLLISLHYIKPGIDPSWRFISEYAIGKNGWLMVLAFLALAISYIALYLAIRPQIPRTIIGGFGLILLLISATGLMIAGIFVTDPVTISKDAQTIAGKLHSLGGTLGMAMPFAAIFISRALIKNKNWSSAKRPVLYAAGLATLGFLVAFISLGIMLSESGGKFGPDVLVGWPNRFEVITYCIWLIVIAWQSKRLK